MKHGIVIWGFGIPVLILIIIGCLFTENYILGNITAAFLLGFAIAGSLVMEKDKYKRGR